MTRARAAAIALAPGGAGAGATKVTARLLAGEQRGRALEDTYYN
jgi:hypothetical protein